MKKSILAILTLIFVLTLASAGAQEAGLAAYKAAAQAVLPADALFVSYELDDGVYSLKYRSDGMQEFFEIDIDRATGAVLKKETDRWDDKGGKTVTLSEESAKQAVLAECPEAQITGVRVTQDDGRYEYEVTFRAGGAYGVYKLHSESGAVLERELNYAADADAVTAATAQAGGQAAGAITAEAAKALVLARTKNGVITQFKADLDDGRAVYEGEARDDTNEYDFEIDAETGAFRSFEVEPLSFGDGKDGAQSTPAASGLIGTDKARSIALSKAGGGRVTSIKLDTEHGVRVYEGKVLTDAYEYEFEINAATGAVLEWDADRLTKQEQQETRHDKDDDDDKDDHDDDRDDKDDHDDDDDDDHDDD